MQSDYQEQATHESGAQSKASRNELPNDGNKKQKIED